ncbi:MAG TPA: translocation/assembly module TamB domain-containing protein, partial [Myxococcales bacterium]|nr:translocation/assembly module TamB domain-containing protein [Myxococcales bacterium]
AGVHVVVPRANVSIHGKGESMEVEVATRGGTVALPQRRIAIATVDAQANVDLRGAGQLDLVRADVIGSGGSAFLAGTMSDLCFPQIEALANVRSDDLAAMAAAYLPGAPPHLSGTGLLDTRVTYARGEVKARGDLRLRSFQLAGFDPGDVNARFDVNADRLKLDRLEVVVGRGQVAGTAELGLRQGLPLSTDLSLRDVELAEVLRKLTLQHVWVLLRTGGRVQVKGTLLPLQLGGDANLDLSDFAVLDRAYDSRKGAPQRTLEFARGHISSAVSIDAEKVTVTGAQLEAGASRMQVDGALYTDDKRGLDLHARSEDVSLDDLRGHIADLPWHGHAAVNGRVHGPYADVRIEAAASVRGFHILDVSLGDVSAQADFGDNVLSFSEVKGRKERSTYAGEFQLDFGRDGTPVDARLELPEAYLHDLVDAATGRAPALASVADGSKLDGRVSGTLEVLGPIARPEIKANLALASASLWRQRFDGGEARVQLLGHVPRLQIDRFVLRRGDAEVELTGGVGPDWRFDLDVLSRGLTLADVDVAKAAQLRGALAVEGHLRGSGERPLLDLSGRFAGARAGNADVGDGKLALRIDGTQMRWDADVGTHHLEGRATLAGDFPYSTSLALRFPDLSGYLQTFVPEVDLQGGSLSADLSLSGSLLRLSESQGRGDLNAVQLLRNGTTFENDGPAQLVFGPAGMEVRKLALRAPYTSVTVSGSRLRGGKLDLRLQASIDGRILQNLFADLEHAAGRYLVQASVGGTLQTPTMLGNLRIEDGEARLRGVPLTARDLNGSVSFTQDALVIDELRGKLNSGEAKLSGSVEMQALRPKKIDVAAHLSDVNVRFQDDMPATFDGDVTLTGPPLEPVLAGSVVVSKVRYAEDLDLERSLLDFSRRPPAPRVLGKSALLVHFDLDVHLSRGVRIENNLARADLKGDLKVTGTTRSIGLLGSVNTVHGTAQFRGNEFQIEQGVLTFTDRTRVRPSFDFQATSQVKEYKVRLHAFGTPAEPHVTLTSEPALTEADLGFLLTFGFVSQNLQQQTFNATDSGLAIGMEALSKVTGFSEEVRRFIPKNTFLRDPSLDFASDFSVATNRLEPMASFRSHLLTEKLDLRVLEGLSTRRYRGLVSYQLSDFFSGQLQLDNEHLATGTDFGFDFKLRWEGE